MQAQDTKPLDLKSLPGVLMNKCIRAFLLLPYQPEPRVVSFHSMYRHAENPHLLKIIKLAFYWRDENTHKLSHELYKVLLEEESHEGWGF